MTTIITKYPLYVFAILSMCLFCGGCFYRSINKEKTQERIELAMNLFMTIGMIIWFILQLIWVLGNVNGTK